MLSPGVDTSTTDDEVRSFTEQRKLLNDTNKIGKNKATEWSSGGGG